MIQLLIPFSLFLTQLDNLIKKYIYPLFLIHFKIPQSFYDLFIIDISFIQFKPMPKLTVVVVFPVPPFWFAMPITLHFDIMVSLLSLKN